MSRSMCPGATPALSMAALPDAIASVAVVPPTRRSRMPLRSTIHSSLVSSMASRSALVTTLSGSAVPQPEMRADVMSPSCRSRGAIVETPPPNPKGIRLLGGRSRRPKPRDRLTGHHPLAQVREDPFDASRERRPNLRLANGAEQVACLDRPARVEIRNRGEEPGRRAHDHPLGHEEMLALVVRGAGLAFDAFEQRVEVFRRVDGDGANAVERPLDRATEHVPGPEF